MARFIVLTVAVVTAWCSLIAVAGAGLEVPKRKPGLWEITTIGAGTGTNTARICIGADDKILTPEGSKCGEPKVSSGGPDTTIVDVVCALGEGKETISGAFTGDFSVRYQAQVRIAFEPPPQGLLPHMGVTINGKYLGPDCSGADAPGDAK